jgi:hypothetical protein
LVWIIDGLGIICVIFLFCQYRKNFYLWEYIYWNHKEKQTERRKNKKMDTTLFFILLLLSSIKVFIWFKKFDLVLPVIFTQFLLMFFILCFLKNLLYLITQDDFSNKKLIIFVVLWIVCLALIVGVLNLYSQKDVTAIRITKGNIKELEKGSIKVFFKNSYHYFFIERTDKKLYIKKDTLFNNYEIKKTLINKENNVSLIVKKIISEDILSKVVLEHMKDILLKKMRSFLFNQKTIINPLKISFEEEVKQGEILFINNENSRILDGNGKEINNKISIEGKIVVIGNNIKNYIFLDNNLGWNYLNEDKKIGIEEDNFDINVLNLALFLFSVLYFWLKLYGKKSSEYYNKEIINKIKNTSILLDRNKYDKFLTLSMFGVTVPNIWKIIITKNIGERNSSIWTKIDVIYIILFSILLFCLIISKEISECVKELENEKEGYIEYYI